MNRGKNTCKDCIHYDVCLPIKTYEDARCQMFKSKGKFLEIPYEIGTKLYKVTKPYRAEPKVTEFVVKGFRTSGKKHRLQLEVAVNGVTGTNFMYPEAFKETREEAEKDMK